MGRVRGKEKSLAVENSAMKLVRGRKNLVVNGRRQEGKRKTVIKNSSVCMYYV